MPSAVVLSILIHGGLFLLAGMLVVFTVVKKEEQKFEPPKAIERPKMKLRKPKVKVKKTSKPKPTTRIVTKMNRASMPEIQLPEMSGIGDGLGDGGGLGGFDMMPDFNEVTIFGSGQSIGNDFIGTFYDFKRDRSGRNIPHSLDRAVRDIKEFVRNGWKTSELARYYRSPKNLFATTFVMTAVPSSVAPWAFGEYETIGYLWMVHYKGKLTHTEPITFRFWGYGDDFMAVAVDGELVLSTGWLGGNYAGRITPQWQTSSPDSFKYFLGNGKAVVGDWITLEPGDSLDMEFLATEMPGGTFSAALLVEVEGVEYERNRQNGPILPIFKTEQPSLDLVDAIYMDLATGEACVTNGPIFRDYGMSTPQTTQPESELTTELPEISPENSLRTWTQTNGNVVEAKLLTVIGNQAVLETSNRRQHKIPMDQLSAVDRKFIELANPPTFNIDFSKQSSQRLIKDSPLISGSPPKVLDYIFSAKLAQTSAGEYNHELKVEFFAIGDETNGDNFILLDRKESHFTPTTENERSHMFSGKKVTLVQTFSYDRRGETRGRKYSGYLIVVTDERGQIIDYGTSNKWLLDILDRLRELPFRSPFDKSGTRVYAPRATTIIY